MFCMGMFFAEVFLITLIQNRGRMQTASHTALSSMTPSLIQHQQTGDFEHQASLLKGWNQDYLQLSAGAFEGYVSELYLRDMHLFLEYTNQVLYQSGHLGEDVIAIGVPLQRPHGMFCGSSCQPAAVHLYSGSQGFEYISAQETLVGVLTIKREVLLAALCPDEQAQLMNVIKQARLLPVSESAWIKLCTYLSGTFERLATTPELAESTAFLESVRMAGLEVIADCLLPAADAIHVPGAKSWKMITEVRELVSQPDTQALTVADLCQKLGTSRRSLQYHFEQALDISPIAFLRAERLNGVRRMLKTANSVTEAATHWGFWHFGHFSQEYKKMFGELPSTTFRRLHPLN